MHCHAEQSSPKNWIGPTAMEKELKKTTDEQQYVSTNADTWSAYNRSFLGGDGSLDRFGDVAMEEGCDQLS